MMIIMIIVLDALLYITTIALAYSIVEGPIRYEMKKRHLRKHGWLTDYLSYHFQEKEFWNGP
jgi:hypothetical protein